MNNVPKKTFYFMTITLLVFLLLTAVVPFTKFSFTNSSLNKKNKRVKIIGHRGAAGIAPENTIASFKQAIALGIDFIELDLHVTKDNRLVVMHDSNVARTTNGTGEIESLTLEEIKRLDAGSWFNAKYSNEKVPTFEEVLALISTTSKMKLLVELKWPKKGIYTNLVGETLRLLNEYKLNSRVIIQSFEIAYINEVVALSPTTEVHQLAFGNAYLLPIHFSRNFGFGKIKLAKNISSLNLFYIYVDQALVNEMHKNNLSVFAYTLNTKEKIYKAINIGVDGIITDYPNIAKEALKEL